MRALQQDAPRRATVCWHFVKSIRVWLSAALARRFSARIALMSLETSTTMCSDGHWARLTHGSTAALVAPLGLAAHGHPVTRALRRWQRWQRWQRWWGHTGTLGHDAGDAVAKVALCASTHERQDDRYALASHSTVLALFARLPVCLLTTLFPPHTTTPSTTTSTTPATSAGPHSAASRDSGPTRPVRRPRLRHDVAPRVRCRVRCRAAATAASCPRPLPQRARRCARRPHGARSSASASSRAALSGLGVVGVPGRG